MLKFKTILLLLIAALAVSTLTMQPVYAANEKGPRCNDGIDNDLDGLVDSEDPDCSGENQTADLEARVAELEAIVLSLQAQIDGIGPHFSGNHDDLTNVGPNDHHEPVDVSTLQADVSSNTAGVAGNSNKLQFVSVVNGELNRLSGPHFIIEGANVHIRSGTGGTYTFGGLGNLIIGYNEIDSMESSPDSCSENYCPDRTGSHNLVVGADHEYTGWGSLLAGQKNASHIDGTFVAGRLNTTDGGWSSVLGGEHNEAIGQSSTIGGGLLNLSEAYVSHVSGGSLNSATAFVSAVLGGNANVASGSRAVVSGGDNNEAFGDFSVVSAGNDNVATGRASSVSGGVLNHAIGDWSAVSGGGNRTALSESDWVAGSLFEDN